MLVIYFFTPYAFDKKLVKAFDNYIMLLPELNDWAFLVDGDAMFLRSDFGHQIADYIRKYPNTGLFTSYASRCHYQCQVKKGTDITQDSIIYHKDKAEETYKELHGQVKQINRRIAGHLIGIKKQTWFKIRQEVFKNCANKQILGVDTKISYAILKHGYDIKLMRGMYLMHYMRLKEGVNHTKHLTDEYISK